MKLFPWACSAVGSAFGSHPRGRGFESLQVHQNKSTTYRVVLLFWYGIHKKGFENKIAGRRGASFEDTLTKTRRGKFRAGSFLSVYPARVTLPWMRVRVMDSKAQVVKVTVLPSTTWSKASNMGRNWCPSSKPIR